MNTSWTDDIEEEEEIYKASEIVWNSISKAFKCSLEVSDLDPCTVNYILLTYYNQYAVYTINASSKHIGNFLMFVSSTNLTPHVSIYYNFPCYVSLVIAEEVLSSIGIFILQQAVKNVTAVHNQILGGVLHCYQSMPLNAFKNAILDSATKESYRAAKEIASLQPLISYLDHHPSDESSNTILRHYTTLDVLLDTMSLECELYPSSCRDCINTVNKPIIDPINIRVASVRGLKSPTITLDQFHLSLENSSATTNLRKYFE